MSIKTVTAKGRIFGEGTQLELFPDSKDKQGHPKLTNWTTIFGRNGSGKTTLSHAFWNASNLKQLPYGNSDTNTDVDLEFSRQQTTLMNNIFVFNEDFIRSVRFENDNLGAIVMLGSQGTLMDQLDQAEEDKTKLEQQIDEHSFQLGQETRYGTQPNATSKTLHDLLEIKKRNIEKNFRNKGWADNSRKIKENRRNDSVRFQDLQVLYLDLASKGEILPSNDITERRKKFDYDVDSFLKTKNANKINPLWDDNASNCTVDNISIIQKLLGSIPEVESVPEDEIISVLQKGEHDISSGETQAYLETNPNRCKLCLQSIAHEWIAKVLIAFDQLNQQSAIEDMKQSLGSARQPIENEIRRVSIAIPNIYDSLQIITAKDKSAKDEYLQALQVVLTKINEKNDKPMAVLSLPSASDMTGPEQTSEMAEVLEKQKMFYHAVREVNNRVQSYNQTVDESENRKANLLKENDAIALSDNSTLFEEEAELQKRCEQYQSALDNLLQQHDQTEKTILSLHAEQQQTGIAMERINASLRLIFLSSTRLTLNPKEGSYGISVNGSQVSLSQLSAGEKDAIALAYFFAQPMSDKAVGYTFDNDLLFIIDDPITSLDRDNAIGIYSMIEHELRFYKEQLAPEVNLQICVLTHSLSAFTAFDKIADTIFKYRNKRLQLSNGSITKATKIKLNYRNLISNAFEFAKTDITSLSSEDYSNSFRTSYESVGNELRRSLEEYSFFNFDVDQTGMLNSKLIQDKLEQEVQEKRLGKNTLDMIQGTLFHLWLNDSSHGQNNAESSDFYDHQVTLIDAQQSVRSARLIMILLSIIHYTGLPGLLKAAPSEDLIDECDQCVERWKNDFEGTDLFNESSLAK